MGEIIAKTGGRLHQTSSILPPPPTPASMPVDSYVSPPGAPKQPKPFSTVERFVVEKPANLQTLGIPLLQATDQVLGLEEGKPLVFAVGAPKTWRDMPIDHKTTCVIYARGIVWTSRQDIKNNLKDILNNPVNHPKLMTGVLDSRDVRTYKDVVFPVIRHVENLQEGEGTQYLTDVVLRDVGHGFTFAQRTLDDIDTRLKPEELFPPDRRTDLVRHYVGQVQILEVANGTAIIMEVRTFIARVPEVASLNLCGIAADSGLLPNFLGGNKAVKQRIESRLKNLWHAVTDPTWAAEQGIKLAQK